MIFKTNQLKSIYAPTEQAFEVEKNVTPPLAPLKADKTNMKT